MGLAALFGGGQKRPQLCPSCGSLVGINATKCHQCGASLRFGMSAWSKGLAELFGGRAPVTTAVLIVNVVMFAVSLLRSMKEGGGFGLFGGMNGIELYRLGENIPYNWPGWGWWRMVTGTFLHGGLLHIGMNMFVLMDIGPVVEEVYGSARYLFVYTACAIGGSVLSTFAGSHPSVGASGAIMGLLGALIAITTKRGGAQIREMRSRLISWVVTIFAFGFLAGGVDNWGHFGGLATGFAVGKLLADREPNPGPERTQAYAMGWIAFAVLAVAFVQMLRNFGNPLPV